MGIPFVKDDETTSAGIYHPQSNLMRVVAENAGPFTYTGTGTYIIHDSDHCVVIDPGPALDAHIEAMMRAIGDMAVEAILVTHTHRDHSPASRTLALRTKAEIWGCAPAGTVKIDTNSVAMDESQDTHYCPARVLKGDDVLDLRCCTLKVFATPGHLANHLCYLWQEENALFSGDHIMGWATSVVIPPDGHMASYMKSLERTLALNVSAIWPTHGQPITDPEPFIKALIDHRQGREKSILAQIRQNNGAIALIVEALYTDIPKALYPAAAQSVFAHIIHLAEQGLVEPTNHLTIRDFFRPK